MEIDKLLEQWSSELRKEINLPASSSDNCKAALKEKLFRPKTPFEKLVIKLRKLNRHFQFRTVIYSSVLLLVIASLSCLFVIFNRNTVFTDLVKQSEDRKIINTVKLFERNDFNYNHFNISYDTYKNNIKDYSCESYLKNLDGKCFGYSFIPANLTGGKSDIKSNKDLIGLSSAEIRELLQAFINKRLTDTYGTVTIDSMLDISDVSAEDSLGMKHVYIKENVKVDKFQFMSSTPMHIMGLTLYRNYSFIKKDGKYKVDSIIQAFHYETDQSFNSDTEYQEYPENFWFGIKSASTFNGAPVNYTNRFDAASNN